MKILSESMGVWLDGDAYTVIIIRVCSFTKTHPA